MKEHFGPSPSSRVGRKTWYKHCFLVTIEWIMTREKNWLPLDFTPKYHMVRFINTFVHFQKFFDCEKVLQYLFIFYFFSG